MLPTYLPTYLPTLVTEERLNVFLQIGTSWPLCLYFVNTDDSKNKHQIHRHLQSVRMLCSFKNQNLLSNEMG